MKKLVIILVVIMSLVACNQQAANYLSLDGLGLKGDVVSITSEMNSATTGDTSSMLYFAMNLKLLPNYTLNFEDGQLVRSIERTASGYNNLEKEYIYRNDNLDQIIHHVATLSGEEQYTFDFDLDDKGNLNIIDGEQHIDIAVDGKKVGSSYHASYEDGERMQLVLFNNGEGLSGEEDYRYKDDKLRSVTFRFDDRETTYSFVYDNDVMTEMTKAYSGIEEVYTFDYEYDEVGNWVKQNIYFNDELKNTVTRTIEYK